MKIYKCDRCGKHFEERPLNLEINDRRAIYPQTIKSFDLCDECFKSFDEWLGVPYEIPSSPDNRNGLSSLAIDCPSDVWKLVNENCI